MLVPCQISVTSCLSLMARLPRRGDIPAYTLVTRMDMSMLSYLYANVLQSSARGPPHCATTFVNQRIPPIAIRDGASNFRPKQNVICRELNVCLIMISLISIFGSLVPAGMANSAYEGLGRSFHDPLTLRFLNNGTGVSSGILSTDIDSLPASASFFTRGSPSSRVVSCCTSSLRDA